MYQPGKMGIAEGLSLVFVLTFVPVFLSIWAVNIDHAKSAAWIIPLINGPLVFLLLLGVLWVMKRFSAADLLDAVRSAFGKFGMWAAGLIYMLQFLAESVLLLREFAENTLLTALPRAEFSFTIFFFVALSVILVFLGIEAVARASYVILPFILLGIIFVICLLQPKYILYHLAPWQGEGWGNLLQSGVKVSGFNFGLFMIPLLGRSFQRLTTIRQACMFGFGLSVFFRTVMVICYSLTFGSAVGREKVLPFFEMVRLAYASRYLQRLEALFILLWVMAGILAIATAFYMTLYLIARLFRLPSIQPLIVPIAVIVADLAMMPDDITTVILMHGQFVNTLYNLGSLLIPCSLIIAALFKRRRQGKCPAAPPV